jgi:hypothetical protein
MEDSPNLFVVSGSLRDEAKIWLWSNIWFYNSFRNPKMISSFS